MNIQSNLYLGIDVSKAKLDVALALNGKFRNKIFANTATGFSELSAWLTRYAAGPVHVCMEATGVYWEAAAEYLADAGHTVSVINPALSKALWPILGPAQQDRCGRCPLAGGLLSGKAASCVDSPNSE